MMLVYKNTSVAYQDNLRNLGANFQHFFLQMVSAAKLCLL